MKKVRISSRGHMIVEIYYDAGIEIEVPEDMDESEVEEFVNNNEDLKEQFNNAVREQLQSIHDDLTEKFGSDGYDEEGGYDEIWVEEINGEDGDE
jgi:hypothetical protein